MEQDQSKTETLAAVRSSDGLCLPPITQQQILHVDGTPDAKYAIRILEAYRENCRCKFASEPPNPLWDAMNVHQDERAAILDEAIQVLKKHWCDKVVECVFTPLEA